VAINLKDLLKEFPRSAISWRAQSVTSEGTKALALAYIDARDVMKRLDEVCGMEGWQCKYSHANGKTICDIGIQVETPSGTFEWIWKADGAGDTDIEAEKGAISDAFKRAAVKWGVGRYLYDLDSPWVPCEAYKGNDNKWKWKKFTADPWSLVKTPSLAKEIYGTNGAMKEKHDEILQCIFGAETHEQLKSVWKDNNTHIQAMRKLDQTFYDNLEKAKENQKVIITERQATVAAFGEGFNNVGGM
jgi:hypothetical protein